VKEKTFKITVRIQEQTYLKLKDEAEARVLPVNAVINRILENYVIFYMRKNMLPTITTSKILASKIVQKLSQEEMEEIALQGPKTILKLFTLLDLDFNLQNIIEHYFSIVEKYCGWYSFNYTKKGNHLRLIFNSDLGPRWNKFLVLYISAILKSLKLKFETSTINSMLVFKIHGI